MHGQSDHLGKITDRSLRRVGLPVGIGAEADGGIEGEVGRNQFTAEALRIERQRPLYALDEVSEQDSGQAESQQRSGIVRPMLLGGFVDAAEFVNQALQRADHGMQKRALAFEEPRHEGAHRLGQRQQNEKEEDNLKKY